MPLLLGIVACLGCSISEDVKARDSSVFFPAARITLAISPEEARRLGRPYTPEAPGEGTSHPARTVKFSSAVDLDFGYGRGEDFQTLSGSKILQFAGTTFRGPARVESTSDLYRWSAAGRLGMWLADRVAIEGLFGLGFEYLDLLLESAGERVRDTTFSWGPVLGARLTGRILDQVTVYGQYTSQFTLGDTLPGGMEAHEVGLTASPYPGIAVMAGWRWWNYDEQRLDGDGDVELRFSGPTVGLHFTF